MLGLIVGFGFSSSTVDDGSQDVEEKDQTQEPQDDGDTAVDGEPVSRLHHETTKDFWFFVHLRPPFKASFGFCSWDFETVSYCTLGIEA